MNHNTRAKIPTPPRKSFLPSAPGTPQAANNMKAERLAPMTFNMPRDWHTRFKMAAVQRGINMKDLLIECFAAWEREQSSK